MGVVFRVFLTCPSRRSRATRRWTKPRQYRYLKMFLCQRRTKTNLLLTTSPHTKRRPQLRLTPTEPQARARATRRITLSRPNRNSRAGPFYLIALRKRKWRLEVAVADYFCASG